ncbi:MAG: YfiT family bacillithiol transferase [Saprospiraceae bacterium]
MDLDQLRYPVGKFASPSSITAEQIALWIEEIKALPELLHRELDNISATDLVKTYRPGGWNITQLVHHLADSHMTSFIRFKLSLTEEHPVIKPYLEDEWGKMADNKELNFIYSLNLLTALHYRWGYILDHMKPEQFINNGYFHPDKKRVVPLQEATALYAWHCRHHLAHIRNAKNS